MLSSELASYASPAAWKETRSALNARLGAGAEAAVVRLTWYDDPQNAPTHGRYAAADYRVDYPHEAFACGYVVWLRQSDGGYLEIGRAYVCTPVTHAHLVCRLSLGLIIPT